MTSPATDVFLSYKAEDRARLTPLVAALEAEGFTVWWDAHIGGGTNWHEDIEQHLDAAKCVVVAWSKRSVGHDGHFVRDEARRAQRRDAYVPVCLDGVEPPLGFGEIQALSLKGWKGDRSDRRFQALADAVRSQISGEPISHAYAHFREPGVSRRVALAGGIGVGAVAVAGAGGWLLLKPGAASGSIAVLPFANLSGDPGQAYFSDGIAEELRSALSRVAGLKVAGRTSSEIVRNDDAETAAKKLGVSNILTGSVRQSPSVIRVSAQLVDGENGMERWSQTYDRAPGDAIKIQTDIAENVARSLSTALGGVSGDTLIVGGTQNAAAQNLILQAEQAADEDTRAGLERSVQLADAALRLDPNYADAYARKAISLHRLGGAYATGSAEMFRTRTEAFGVANKAISLAPNLARAHYALGRIYEGNLEIAKAAAEYARALQLAPGDAALLRRYSYFVAKTGNLSESLRISDKVVELDPLNPDSYENRAGALFDLRRYADAISYAEEVERKSPELVEFPILLGDCLLLLGRYREAEEQYALGKPDQWERLTGEAMVMARTRDRAGASRKLQRMQQLFGDAASYQYGEIYAQLGDKDHALAALERAWEIRDGGLMNIRNDPALDPLRSDPRFEAIIKRMNFPS
ncbi:MAG: TIR domain-containing protein [Sphingomicrobium sp.]